MSAQALAGGPIAARNGRSRLLRSIGLWTAGGLLFTAGIGTGLLSDDVGAIASAYPQKQGPSRDELMPAHLRGRSAEPAVVQASATTWSASQQGPAPFAEWFPANNSVTWGVSVDPSQPLSGISVRNAETDEHRIVYFHMATGDASQPWILAATLHLRAGGQGSIWLPQGDYMVSNKLVPVMMPQQVAMRREPSAVSRVSLYDPPVGNEPDLRMTIASLDRASFFSLSRDVGRRGATLASTAPRRSIPDDSEYQPVRMAAGEDWDGI